MSHNFSRKFKTARVRILFAAAPVLACAFTVTNAGRKSGYVREVAPGVSALRVRSLSTKAS
jgi:hypothetical protein